MEARELKCALTQPYWSTFYALTLVVSLYLRRVRSFSLARHCVLNDLCISVNCIMANQLIFFCFVILYVGTNLFFE